MVLEQCYPYWSLSLSQPGCWKNAVSLQVALLVRLGLLLVAVVVGVLERLRGHRHFLPRLHPSPRHLPPLRWDGCQSRLEWSRPHPRLPVSELVPMPWHEPRLILRLFLPGRWYWHCAVATDPIAPSGDLGDGVWNPGSTKKERV